MYVSRTVSEIFNVI